MCACAFPRDIILSKCEGDVVSWCRELQHVKGSGGTEEEGGGGVDEKGDVFIDLSTSWNLFQPCWSLEPLFTVMLDVSSAPKENNEKVCPFL